MAKLTLDDRERLARRSQIGPVSTTVLRRGEARFDMVGRKLPYNLHDTGQTISGGLTFRLYRFALQVLEDGGFSVSSWNCEVYTMDGDLKPADRYYTVEFTNPQGGMLGVQGITTLNGWPTAHHGVCVDVGRAALEASHG